MWSHSVGGSPEVTNGGLIMQSEFLKGWEETLQAELSSSASITWRPRRVKIRQLESPSDWCLSENAAIWRFPGKLLWRIPPLFCKDHVCLWVLISSIKNGCPRTSLEVQMFPDKNPQSRQLKEVTAIPAWEFCSQVQGSCCDRGWTLGNSEATSILVADLGAEGVIKPHRDQECITSDGCDMPT